MGSKTKKTKAAGKFGAGFGVSVRKEYNAVEALQRKTQPSPLTKKGKAKRIAAGIWKDVKTGKIFTGHAYFLNQK